MITQFPCRGKAVTAIDGDVARIGDAAESLPS